MVLFSSLHFFFNYIKKKKEKHRKCEQQIPINSQKKINPCRTTAFQITPFQEGTLVHECWRSAEKRFKHTSPLNRERSRQDKLITLLNRDRNVCESGLMPRGISQICLTLTRVFKEPQKWISTHTNTPGGQRWSLLFVLQGESESFILKCSTINIIPASCVCVF